MIALDFDGTRAYPMYDWMGVMKAGLESLGRYLAREVGPDKIRVNMLAAGPVRTMAAKSIPGFALFEDTWAERAPLGWDVYDSSAVADTAIALLSPLLRGNDRVGHPRRRRRPRHGLALLLGELGLVQVVIEATRREQFVVRAALDDPTFLEHQDLISVSDG